MRKPLSTFKRSNAILMLLFILSNSLFAADFSPKNTPNIEKALACNSPILNDITQQSICFGGSFNAVSTSVLNGVTVSYQWYNDNGTNNPTTTSISGQTTATLTTLPTAVGTYKYKVVATNTSDNTCFSEKSVTLAIVPAPSSQEICPGESFTATAQSGITNIQWKKLDGGSYVNILGQTSSTLNITEAGTYKYTAEDATTGCVVELCCPIVLTACCPNINNPSTAQSICIGVSGSNMTVNIDKKITNGVKFVKFTSDQIAGASPTAGELTAIYAGTSLATVTPTGASAPFTATYTWNSADFPNATTSPITYYVYAITNPGTASCQEVEEIQVTVNPIPTVTDPTDQTICNNSTTTAVAFTGSSVSGTTYSWTNDNTSIGLAASGTGDITAFTAINTGTSNATATITVTPMANGCAGTPQTFTITVKPTPSVSDPIDQAICHNTTTTAVTFTGSSVSGTTYSWTNDNTSIGLAASGTGDIAAFTATNSGSSNATTATITVTPMANGCVGTPQTFTITVKPTPSVSDPIDQAICHNTTTTAVSFTGSSVTGTTYSWTNDNTSIGLAASGTGDIAAFTAINSGSSNATATITVTPMANGCAGTPQTFTITVKPTPSVSDPTDQTDISGATIAATTFSGSAGTTFNWTNDNTATGLAASGTGDITAFTAAVVTTPQVSIITVTPMLNGCAGTPQTFTITVNPAIPFLNDPVDVTLCEEGNMNTVTFTGTSGATFNWTNDNTNVGISASGTGDIMAFTLPNITTQQVANITVTPVKNGVSGTPQTFVLTIRPKVVSGTATSVTLCNSSTTAVDLASLLTGEDAGGTWTRVSGTGGTFTATSGSFTPSAGVTTSIFRYTMTATSPCPNESTDVTINFQNCCPLPNCGTVTLTKN
jgi:hypothetical protein